MTNNTEDLLPELRDALRAGDGGLPGERLNAWAISEIEALRALSGTGKTTREKVCIAANSLFEAYRSKYLSPTGRRIRENAPLRSEMGDLKVAIDAMMAEAETNA